MNQSSQPPPRGNGADPRGPRSGAPSQIGGLLGRGAVGTVPLERALSKRGICSRGQARVYIAEGRIEVDGVVCRDPLMAVHPERVALRLDGADRADVAPRLIALHKPRSVLTTRVDPKGRPTVYDALDAELGWLGPVGRLDFATSGLLLLTNDTRLADALTDPRTGIEREYVATVRGRFDEDASRRLCEGVVDAGERLGAQDVRIEKVSGRESRLRLILQEGRNREVRRMCAAVGHPVQRLLRVRYGPIALDELAPGAWREEPIERLRAFVAAARRGVGADPPPRR